MKQIITYESFDGLKFLTEQECLDYEGKHREQFFIMYDWQGKSVDQVDQAIIVYIDFKDPDSAYNILNTMSEEQGSSIDGIEMGDCGWFYWNEYEDRYYYISSSIVEALLKCKR